DSRLILALDFPSGRIKELLGGLRELAVGVKVGFPLTLSLGFDGVRELLREFPDYYWIADYKIADIPEVAQYVISRLEDMGFDAAIMHLFTGQRKYETGMDLIGVAAMSHPEAKFFRGNFIKLLEEAELLEIEGIVVGATRPEMVREARRRLPKARIFSPGVGAQGAEPGSAIAAGADLEIVGRSIVKSDNPIEEAMRVVEAHRGVIHGRV
ncbi:MAG: orotidine 5'-phosphate decarboxylase / HUMPS family protein, partial [Candidatus Korarchaeum sp.]